MSKLNPEVSAVSPNTSNTPKTTSFPFPKDVAAISLMSSASLLEFFNFYVRPESSKVKRFADRATAIKRCINLYEDVLKAKEVEDENADLSDEEFEAKMRRELDENVAAEIKAETKAIDVVDFPSKDGVVFKTKTINVNRLASNSLGIARSWTRPEVAEARLTRNGVLVKYDGAISEFKSVRSAFAALGLPDEKHIKFRMLLKASKEATFEFNGVKYLFILA